VRVTHRPLERRGPIGGLAADARLEPGTLTSELAATFREWYPALSVDGLILPNE
jgi:hypothetical protein